jgi:hypothetical protein
MVRRSKLKNQNKLIPKRKMPTKNDWYFVLLGLVIVAHVFLSMAYFGILAFIPLTYLAYLLMEKALEKENPSH